MISAAGLVLIYRNAEDDERAWLQRTLQAACSSSTPGRTAPERPFLVRLAAGLLLFGLGVFVLAIVDRAPLRRCGRSKGRCS